MNNIEEKRYILWLNNIAGIGSAKGNILLKTFGSAKKIFEMDKNDLCKINFLDSKIIAELIKKDFSYIDSLEETLKKHNIKYVTINDEDYPYYLKE